MADSFWQAVTEQLKKNLGDSLEALGAGEVDWTDLGVGVISQLLILMVYLGLYASIYLAVMAVLKSVVGQKRSNSHTFAHVRTGLRYLVGLGFLLTVLAQFGATPELLQSVAKAGFIALGFYVGWLVLGRVIVESMQRAHLDPSIRQLVDNLFAVLLVAFGAVTVLAQFGFDVLSIVAGLGIVGIAVGFAAQSTLSNFIAGVTLLIERPFRIGDWVTINGQDGKVVKIALRTTWLRTRDNIFTMIPNDSVASSEIVNFSTEGAIRLNISVGIAYKERAEAARQIIMPILEQHPEVLQVADMMPKVMLSNLGDSSIDLIVQAWIGPDNLDVQPSIKAELLEQIKDALDHAGIEIPFPHLQLFIDDAKGLKPVMEPFYPKLAGQ
ncbi:mechanosensitive ion channel family protein [Marinobacter apostichopi]|uniref:mechanosensitive ion channel family protein n=1 Tax=Marinobacter apostichopi TaxID=3035454 RepID=UPI0025748721|nr:mechanosensitive ion channel family protein [Marinobacter sp. LA51]